jgi:hypothetical protein
MVKLDVGSKEATLVDADDVDAMFTVNFEVLTRVHGMKDGIDGKPCCPFVQVQFVYSIF